MAAKPTLLLSPDGSWGANGRVEPTITGGVIVVPGQHGNAWQIPEATTNLFTNPALTTTAGMTTSGGVVINVIAPPAGVGLPADLEGTVTTIGRSTVGSTTSSHLNLIWTYPELTLTAAVHTYSVYLYIPSTWTGSNLHITTASFAGISSVYASLDMAKRDEWQRVSLQVTPAAGDLSGSFFLQAANGGVAGQMVYFAGIQVEPGEYATPFAHGDMPGHAWTGTPHASASTGPAASIGAPLATAPQSVLVRYSEDGGTTHLDEHRIGAGTFGTNGDITYSGGAMTVAPSSGSVQVESALIFDTALTADEIAEYTNMGAWTWDNTFRPHQPISFPDIRSGLHLVETKIHKSDMYGNIGDEITGEVVTAGITSDLDRAGSKTHIDITAVGTANLLPAGSWITPVQEVSREGEGTVQVQRGVFELDQPEVESAGVRFIISNSGKDIVDLLARSALLDTFYTPVDGHVMGDVELAIRMAGITSMGPNIHPNGDFEDDTGLPDGWVIWRSTSDITVNTVAAGTTPVPSGKYVMRHIIPSGQPGTAFAAPYMNITLPASLEKVLVTGMYYKKDVMVDPFIYMGWVDAEGTTIKTEYLKESGLNENSNMVWTRTYGVSERPAGAVVLRVLTRTNATEATTGSLEVLWDDIQVRPCTGDLLPASMLALPPSTAKATSRIQHLTSDARLAAVNDRLSAISMMAVNATNDSKYTSRMSRDPNKDAAVRQYEIEKDIRITGDIQTWRNTSNKYNRVFAVKEDYTEGTVMTAIAENKDLDDPWNIYRSVLTPKRIDVRDAVDVAALQLAADQELAKASMQESVSFSIVPDPTLTVYDIIEISGPDTNPAIGKWAIESIDSGLTASDPLMNIGARRTKKGV